MGSGWGLGLVLGVGLRVELELGVVKNQRVTFVVVVVEIVSSGPRPEDDEVAADCGVPVVAEASVRAPWLPSLADHQFVLQRTQPITTPIHNIIVSHFFALYTVSQKNCAKLLLS